MRLWFCLHLHLVFGPVSIAKKYFSVKLSVFQFRLRPIESKYQQYKLIQVNKLFLVDTIKDKLNINQHKKKEPNISSFRLFNFLKSS